MVVPHYLEYRLTDGGEVVSLTRRPPFTLSKIPGTHFCYRLSRLKAIMRLERLGKLKKPNDPYGIEPATFRLVA
jgi:hypothetical protein